MKRLFGLQDNSIRKAEKTDDRLILTLSNGKVVHISAAGFLNVYEQHPEDRA